MDPEDPITDRHNPLRPGEAEERLSAEPSHQSGQRDWDDSPWPNVALPVWRLDEPPRPWGTVAYSLFVVAWVVLVLGITSCALWCSWV